MSRKLKAADSIHRAILETLENRLLLAAHIVGSTAVYTTIQAAVDAAAAGATINVDAGNYAELVTVYKTLTLRGAKAGVDARTTRTGETILTNNPTAIKITANDVTIDGFTIQGTGANIGAGLGAGIIMGPSIHGTHILNNIVQKNITGIYLSNNSATDACVIQRNLIQNNYEAGQDWTFGWNGSRGIYTDGTISGGNLTNVLIDNNRIYNTVNGADMGEGLIALQALTAGKQSDITISNNYIGGDSKAILATNVTNLSFIGNTATNTNDGSSGPVRFEGNANVVNIQYNSIFNNGGPGVAADSSGVSGDSSGFVVNNNNIYQNDGIGVLVIANVYNGPLIAVNDWWGSASGPSGLGPGTGQQVWGNGTSGHYMQPKGAPGGNVTFSPWATALINIANIPVPAAPSALTATPLSTTQAQLSWTAQMSTATSQLIQRSTDGVTFATVATVSPLVKTYTDTGLTTGVTYRYRIIAANNTGNSVASNVATAVSPTYQPPVAPTGLSLVAATGSTIAIKWTAPSSTLGVTGYTIYRNGAVAGTSATTSFTNVGLTSNTAYTYTVATNDNVGAISGQSSPLTVSTSAPQFLDASFETTAVGTFAYAPTTANWTFSASAGIEANGSAWAAANAPNGIQAAFLQGATATMSQTLATSPAGNYSISLSAAMRNGYAVQPFTVKVDGTIVATITPTSASFLTYTTPAFALTAGTHTFTFASTATTGDRTTFIDLVSLGVPASAPAAPIGLAAAGISSSQIKLTWTPVGANQTSFTLQRSSDNVTFANVATGIAAGATTYTDASGLSAGTTYYYKVFAVNAVGSSPASNVATGATLSSSAVVTQLSSLNWTSATAGFGAVLKNLSIKGNALILKGVTYPSGLGTHAASTITYNLGGQYNVFQSDVGLDDEVKSSIGGAVDFQVVGDGKILFDSGILTSASPTVSISVSVAGVQTLSLIATNGVVGSIDFDHADWAGAKLLANPVAPAAPTNLTAAVVSSTSIKISWTPTGTTQTGFKIDRSTDGTTWTALPAVGSAVTSYTDTGLTAGGTYSYRVRATNSAGDSPNSNVATATTAASTVSTFLSDIPWTSATAGFSTVQTDKSIKGNALKLKGVTYPKGLGTHAASTITYNLAGQYTTFLSDVGIDDEEIGVGSGSVDFQVIGDGKVLFDSGVLTSASPTASIAISVAGVQTLSLVATNGIPNNIDYDHADWAGATLIGAAVAPSAPANVAAVALSSSSIKVTWTAGSSNVTTYEVDRSTDGINFTSLTTGIPATTLSWTDSSFLSAATPYYYRVRAVNVSGSSLNSAIATATTLPMLTVTYVSDLTWTSATAGYGTVQQDQSIKGNPLTLHGVAYPKGLGTHAASSITYNLAGHYTNFLSDIGIDDEEIGIGSGSVNFQVIGDGKILYDSGTITSSSPTVSINVSVVGVQTLTLVANNAIPNNIDYDHADWAGARLLG